MNNNYEHLPVKELTILRHLGSICEHIEKGENVELWKGIAFGYTFGMMMSRNPEEFSLDVCTIITDVNKTSMDEVEGHYSYDLMMELNSFKKK